MLRKKYFKFIKTSINQEPFDLTKIKLSNIKHYKKHEILKFKYSVLTIVYL